MKLGLLAGVIFIFATLTIMSVTMNGDAVGADDETTMANVTGVRQTNTDDSAWGTVVGIVMTPVNWMEGLVNMVAWNYSFLDNTPGGYFKWIIGSPITAVAVVMVAVVFMGILSKVL